MFQIKSNWFVKLERIATKILVEFKFRTGLGKLALKTEDRDILEKMIFPYFISKDNIKKILFVGVDWYTYQYNRMFTNKEYWTIDNIESKKRYGSNNHIVNSLSNIDKYFKKNYLDLIIANGVFGWGLNEYFEVEKSFDACFRCLKKDGILVIGWNDIPQRKPLNLEDVESLLKFQKYNFPPISNYNLKTDTELKHTFNFYKK